MSKINVCIILVLMVLIGSLSAAFLLALSKFEPSQSGFFNRWIYFTWRYCLAAGLSPALVFLILYYSGWIFKK